MIDFDVLIKYQVGVFGNFEDIEPTTDAITKLLEIFKDKELLPGTFQQITAKGPILRLRLSKANNEWAINIATDRIDIEKNLADLNGANLGTVEDFAKDALDLIEPILKSFNKKGTRVALITSGLLKEMKTEKLEELYSKVFNPTKFYSKNQPFEWNARSVAKQEIQIAEMSEAVNVITTVNRIIAQQYSPKGVTPPMHRINVGFDINTIQENRGERFDSDSIGVFLNEAISLRSQLMLDLKESLDV